MRVGTALLTLAIVAPWAIVARGDESVVRGAVLGDHVFTLRKDQATATEGDTLSLLSASLATGEVQKPIVVWYSIRQPIQWRLERKHLWTITRDWSVDRTVRSGDRVFRFDLMELLKGVRRTGRIPNYSNDVAESIVVGYGPVQSLGVVADLATFRVKVHYDYVPVSAERLRLFVLTNTSARLVKQTNGKRTVEGDLNMEKWNFNVFIYQASWGPNPLAPKHQTWIEGTWTEEASLEVAFREEFHAYSGPGNVIYFITESGKLYCTDAISANMGRAKRNMAAVWTHADQPITHILERVESSKMFVFGTKKDTKEDIRFGFELGKQSNGVRFAASLLKASKCDEPLQTIFQYAQYLRDEEQVREDARVLMIDKRLQVVLPLKKQPELGELLRALSKATGVSFTVEEKLHDHMPVFDIRRRDAPAYEVMRIVAQTQLVDGRWVKHGDGFLLTAKESASAKAHAAKKARDELHQRQLQEQAKNAELRRKFPLRLDPQCLIKIELRNTKPKLPELLDLLRGETGLTLVLADELKHHDPELGEIKADTYHAFALMGIIADRDLENGRWVKIDGGGYRLEGSSKSLKPQGFPWWRFAAGTLAVAAAGAAVLYFRLRRPKRGAP
jgi:hypothetical protein